MTAPPRHARPVASWAGRRKWTVLLALGWFAQVGLRFWVAQAVTLPILDPDEIGYLDASRLLTGGGTRFDLSYNTLYRGGYPLLLTPARWLGGSDPAAVYRWVQFENALIGAALLPLAFALGRRCGLSAPRAYVVGTVTALLPTPIFFGGYALSDAILPVLFLAWLLATHTWLTTATVRMRQLQWGALASALAGYAYLTHSRGALVVIAQACLILTAAIRGWRTRLACGAAAISLLLAAVGSAVVNRFVQHRIYPTGAADLGAIVSSHLRSIEGWGWTLRVATGQIWYQFVATGGLAAVGLIALAAHVVNRRANGQGRAVAATVLLLTVAIAIGSSAALPDVRRSDIDVLQGRYLGGSVTAGLFAVGVAALLKATRRRAIQLAAGAAISMFGTTAVVLAFSGLRARTEFFARVNFPEFSVLTGDSRLHILKMAAAAAAILAVALASSSAGRQGPLFLGSACALVSLATLATGRYAVTAPASRFIYSLSAGDQQALSVSEVAVDRRIAWWIVEPLTYQHGWRHVIQFDGARQAPPAQVDLVIFAWKKGNATETWKAHHAPPGRQIIAQRTVQESGSAAFRSSEAVNGLQAFDGWVAWRP